MSLWNQTAWGQQTAASQLLAAKMAGKRGGMRSARKRRRSLKRQNPLSVSSAKRRRTSKKSTRARLVKGSRAAKAYMAKIRRQRK